MSGISAVELKMDALRVLDPLERWADRCHEASFRLVEAGLADRVARGWAEGCVHQHSWAVAGESCYANSSVIVDATLWAQTGGAPEVWVGRLSAGVHRPHGMGSIWDYGRPVHGGGETIWLRGDLSPLAEDFLEMVGPLDRAGWYALGHAPVLGWPSAEIIGAMHDDERLSVLVPIDVVGMLTDRNPGGLYLRSNPDGPRLRGRERR